MTWILSAVSGRAAPTRRLLAVAAATLLATACTTGPTPATPAPPAAASPASPARPPAATGEVTVFAASSLTDAFTEIAAAFQDANPGSTVTLSFGASSQLRAQLDQGARADVFASADHAQMDAARQAGSLAGDDHVFAGNRLTIITPRDNPRHVDGPCDLAKPGIKFVTSQPSVPVGQYTLAMLDRATAGACGPAFRARVDANTVSREDNVRQIVAKLQLGEGDAAVVYTSDVTPRARADLRQVAIPDELNTLVTYPIATVRGSNPSGGQAFAAFVLTPPAQDILARWGFIEADAANG